MVEDDACIEEALASPNPLPSILAWIVFGLLLLFAPVQPYGMVVRIAYLVLVPFAVWLGLTWAVSHWQIEVEFTDRLVPVLWGAFGGAMLVGAYLSATSTYHSECTEEIMTRDGKECVGDYVPVDGPDYGMALFELMMAGCAFWLGSSKRT